MSIERVASRLPRTLREVRTQESLKLEKKAIAAIGQKHRPIGASSSTIKALDQLGKTLDFALEEPMGSLDRARQLLQVMHKFSGAQPRQQFAKKVMRLSIESKT